MTSSTWAEKKKRLAAFKKPTSVLRLCEDPAIRDRYHAARRDAESAAAYLARMKDQSDVDADALAMVEKQHKAAQAELRAAQKAYDAATVTLTFQALERQELEALQRKHPAGEDEEADGQDTAFDGFAPALIAAASLDGMPEDDARDALNTWPTGDADALWEAAWSVQRTKRSDLGKD